MNELDRIRAFHALVDERQATEVTRFEHGAAFAVPELPTVYDLNFVRVDRAAGATEIATAADSLQARFHHRKVIVPDGAVGKKLAPGFNELGWATGHHVHMARLRPPDREDDVRHVVELSLDRLAPSHRLSTLRAEWGDEEIADRLLEAKRLRARAVPTRHFGIVEDDRVVAYCDLYEAGGVAQIEDVNTLGEARGRGHGRAIVARAAAEADADLVFLDAVADDWPRELYRRLGFDVVGDTYLFLRYPGPLTSLRLQTPRLELRLPTDAEVAELAHAIEEHGIHPREEMPFAVAWTDAVGTPEFVPNMLAHFRDQRARRRPDDWSLNFVAFLDGRPVGSQSIHTEMFPRSRTVATGSYLISPYQRQGLGMEMRTAVLAFAFDVLEATRAESGAVEGNAASARVSEKLGYEPGGWHELRPRGEPVREQRFVLTRERWASRDHVPVEITGPVARARVALGSA